MKYPSEQLKVVPLTQREINFYESLIHWYDADRPGDTMSYDSAHEIATIVCIARSRLQLNKRLREKL